MNRTRRLGWSLVVLLLLAAPAAAPVDPRTAPRKFRYGMVIDTRRCVGCKACMIACKQENKTPPGVSYTGTFFAAGGIYPAVALVLSWPAINVSGQTKRAGKVPTTRERERDGSVST